MNEERFEVQRLIPKDRSTIFSLLCDPQGHVAIDSSGMLQSATGESVGAIGDRFVVQMDRVSLGDFDLGKYDVTVVIREYDQDRHIAWGIESNLMAPIGHFYGYLLQDEESDTLVTSYYDWSQINDDMRNLAVFPIIAEHWLKATLGILERTLNAKD